MVFNKLSIYLNKHAMYEKSAQFYLLSLSLQYFHMPILRFVYSQCNRYQLVSRGALAAVAFSFLISIPFPFGPQFKSHLE